MGALPDSLPAARLPPEGACGTTFDWLHT